MFTIYSFTKRLEDKHYLILPQQIKFAILDFEQRDFACTYKKLNLLFPVAVPTYFYNWEELTFLRITQIF